jgi:mRNA interferase YafQ
MRRLKEAMLLLIANDGPLPPEYFDHGLSGGSEGFRECHVGGDFLLIYDLRDDDIVIFVRTGTHADLFE